MGRYETIPVSQAGVEQRVDGYQAANLIERAKPDPSLAEAEMALVDQGILAYRTKNLVMAIGLLKAATENGARKLDIRPLVFLMRAQFTQEENQAALETALRILEQDPHHVEALKCAARLTGKTGDWPKAKSLWQRAYAIAPSDRESALQVARIAARLGEWAEVETFAALQLENQPLHAEGTKLRIDSILKRKLHEKLPPLLPDCLTVDRATAMRALNAIDSVTVYSLALKGLIDAAPGDAEFQEIVSAKSTTWNLQAIRLEIEGAEADAAQFYRAVRTVAPGNDEAQSGLNRICYDHLLAMREAHKQNQTGVALEQATTAIAIDPNVFDPWFLAGRIYLAASENARGAECFRKCIALAPKDNWAKINLGRALERLEEHSEALRVYKDVIASASESEDAYRLEAERSLANICRKSLRLSSKALREEKYEVAWRHARLAGDLSEIKTQASMIVTTVQREIFKDLSKKFNEASPSFIPAVETYIEMAPDDERALFLFARRLTQNRDYARAKTIWARLVTLTPESSHYQLQVARCCDWLKQPEEGLLAAKAALPGKDEAEAALLVTKFNQMIASRAAKPA